MTSPYREPAEEEKPNITTKGPFLVFKDRMVLASDVLEVEISPCHSTPPVEFLHIFTGVRRSRSGVGAKYINVQATTDEFYNAYLRALRWKPTVPRGPIGPM